MIKNIKADIRADVVGSLLRPKILLAKQEGFKKGITTQLELTHFEDLAVKDAVRIQTNCGVDVLTDGEMRRPVFCHNLVKAVDGFEWNLPGNSVIWFDMEGRKIVDPVTVGVVRKIHQTHDISVDEFSFLRGITNKQTKMTIPSPTMLSYYFVPGISDKVYKKPIIFLHDVADILKNAVIALENAGVTYLQIDAPEFGMLLDPIQKDWFAAKGFDPLTLVKNGVDMINDIISNFHGLTGLHICRGNDKNRFMARGGYDEIAKTVFQQVNADRLLLEFDSDRAGDFSPLRFVTQDKTVVLGLITTKSPQLESVDALIRRIEEASKFVPVDRLAISTQCGFASVAKGNHLTQRDQNNKLRLVAKVANLVWPCTK